MTHKETMISLHGENPVCSECNQKLTWSDDENYFIDSFGAGMCKDSEDSEYFPHYPE